MRINFFRKIEKKILGLFNRYQLKSLDFTIISNNCWGTFIYKKFDLPYQSPFVNLLIFADDYLELLENFSPDILLDLKFIHRDHSKHKQELIERGYFDLLYPIGVIGNGIEIHFLHYHSEEEAKHKWFIRIKRINYYKLLFKFSDSEICSENHIMRFNNLPYKNKICFTSKSYPTYKSCVCLPFFINKEHVMDEWKHSEKHYNLIALLNQL